MPPPDSLPIAIGNRLDLLLMIISFSHLLLNMVPLHVAYLLFLCLSLIPGPCHLLVVTCHNEEMAALYKSHLETNNTIRGAENYLELVALSIFSVTLFGIIFQFFSCNHLVVVFCPCLSIKLTLHLLWEAREVFNQITKIFVISEPSAHLPCFLRPSISDLLTASSSSQIKPTSITTGPISNITNSVSIEPDGTIYLLWSYPFTHKQRPYCISRWHYHCSLFNYILWATTTPTQVLFQQSRSWTTVLS